MLGKKLKTLYVKHKSAPQAIAFERTKNLQSACFTVDALAVAACSVHMTIMTE